MRLPVITLTAVALFGLTSPLHANTIVNENFGELTPQLSATSVGAFSAINGTNVDIVGGSLFGYLCVPPESGNCIDLDCSGGNPESQLRSNQLFAAGTYNLSFDLIGNQRGTSASTSVTFGNYDQGFTLPSNDTSSGIVIDELVTLTSPGYLVFTSNDPAGDNAGTLLDNVVVSTANTTITPEPSALLLLGTGLAGFASVLRKRFVALPLLFDRIFRKATTPGRECAGLGFFTAHMLLVFLGLPLLLDNDVAAEPEHVDGWLLSAVLLARSRRPFHQTSACAVASTYRSILKCVAMGAADWGTRLRSLLLRGLIRGAVLARSEYLSKHISMLHSVQAAARAPEAGRGRPISR
jgi:hypothetical protein